MSLIDADLQFGKLTRRHGFREVSHHLECHTFSPRHNVLYILDSFKTGQDPAKLYLRQWKLEEYSLPAKDLAPPIELGSASWTVKQICQKSSTALFIGAEENVTYLKVYYADDNGQINRDGFTTIDCSIFKFYDFPNRVLGNLATQKSFEHCCYNNNGITHFLVVITYDTPISPHESRVELETILISSDDQLRSAHVAHHGITESSGESLIAFGHLVGEPYCIFGPRIKLPEDPSHTRFLKFADIRWSITSSHPAKLIRLSDGLERELKEIDAPEIWTEMSETDGGRICLPAGVNGTGGTRNRNPIQIPGKPHQLISREFSVKENSQKKVLANALTLCTDDSEPFGISPIDHIIFDGFEDNITFLPLEFVGKSAGFPME